MQILNKKINDEFDLFDDVIDLNIDDDEENEN